MREQITKALGSLLGEPMWAAGRAGSIVWLQFGAEELAVGMDGEPRTVGRHALHIDCPWRWLEAWGDLRADDTLDNLSFLGNGRAVCSSIDADDRGGLRVGFSDGSELHVEPDGQDVEEYWRLLEPARESAHFVVGPQGVEE